MFDINQLWGRLQGHWIKSLAQTAFACCLIVITLGCNGKASESKNTLKSAALNRPVVIKADRSIVVGADGIRVKFRTLVEDSRCPKGSMCVLAGKATVALDVAKRKSQPTTVYLTNQAGQPRLAETQVSGYRLKLVEVRPFPIVGKAIDSKDYEITLIIAKR